MLSFLGLAMIVVFITALAKKKLHVFAALTLVPLAFGILAAVIFGHPILDVFKWIQDGVFFKVNPETGKVAWGVIAPAVTIIFSIFYFDLMLNVGLFDPVAEFFIKKAKGDPLKVVMSTVAVASVVSLNGDTTTTIIICLAAFRALYNQLKLSLWVLAVIIVAPISIWNMLPWGGPTIAAAAALGVDLVDLFRTLLPGMVAAQVVVLVIAYRLGLKERKRVHYDPKSADSVGPEHIEEMLKVIRDKDPHLKRPKLFWVNLAMTLLGITLLILDLAPGGVVFMLLSAIGLVINFPDVDEATERIEDIASDVLPTGIATLGAGVFSGVLTGSGMALALANSISGLIPTALGAHMAPIYAVIATPAIVFLPQDAFYFGIASVLSGVMGQFGITPMEAAVASMVGQSFRLISPVIPALYLLCGETNLNFVDFQKKYARYFWPILVTYLVVFGITGALPY